MRKKIRSLLLALAIGSTPLITTATCDPVSGAWDFFRDDDYDDYYDDYYYEDVYYDDCYFYCY